MGSSREQPSRLAGLGSSERYLGCFLGGAVGDALGAPIEFMSLTAIRAAFGPDGLHDYAPAYGAIGAITDDTQMALFTAEGLLRADNCARTRGHCDVPAIVHRAYLRWLITQGERLPGSMHEDVESGWLIGVEALHCRRAPGGTCLSTLVSGRKGSVAQPINNSKGCGGIMRIAPVGLSDSEDAFSLGCELAAITHGHPCGYLAAGFLAALIAAVVDGSTLEVAIESARAELRSRPLNEECLRSVDAALELARVGPPTAESVEQLGAGWVAEEALAIALFCALSTKTFEEAVILAVNHSGDSDSTGAITGNIVGALLGRSAIPDRWLANLELRSEIEELAYDMYEHFGTPEGKPKDDRTKYPGW